MPLISKVLVANRGEIAQRIIRTCHDLGIATVAVFSDVDAGAPHVRLADEAVRLGPAPSTESYLVIDKIIAAATVSGANAIHPGYGFLAENADFALACLNAGVSFIGPSVKAISIMGSKREAKRLATEADVPVVPGYSGLDQSDSALVGAAKALGFPVLLKASAGGGGKGMQLVRAESGLVSAIESARRVAESAFGDGTLIIERYIESPRHIEIQILGDHHGNLVHVFERECSIQRRHQKIIEETPSTALDDELRERMGAAAVRLGQAIGYHSAGTVEFILAPDGSFYFLEVNTRLQVEHPVTECITGIDLVAEQLRIAKGEPLRFAQDNILYYGAALECRLYAEDPENDFLPASGRLLDFYVPEQTGLRLDSGVETGTEVSIHYDPMLAKVITSARNRSEAIGRMRRALRSMSVLGVKTNREFLLRVLEHPKYGAGEIDTHFIERHRDALSEPEDSDLRGWALAAATLAGQQERIGNTQVLPNLVSGWRNNPGRPQSVSYSADEELSRVDYRDEEGHFEVEITTGGENWTRRLRVTSFDAPALVLEDTSSGHRRCFRVVRDATRVYVHIEHRSFAFSPAPRFPAPTTDDTAGGYKAPMPGKVIAVRVENGQTVTKGDVLLILEAMKMEQPVLALSDGVVSEILVEAGQQVAADQTMIVLE